MSATEIADCVVAALLSPEQGPIDGIMAEHQAFMTPMQARRYRRAISRLDTTCDYLTRQETRAAALRIIRDTE